MDMQKSSELPLISDEDRTRIEKGARQFASYAAFLRWAANFPKDEITHHPNSRQVMMLSPVQSGRFAFAVEGQTILLGTQSFEAVWMRDMPWDQAYISDRLYLCVSGVNIMDVKFPSLALGIHISTEQKRALLSGKDFIQPIMMDANNGLVSSVGGVLGESIPIGMGDVDKGLLRAYKERVKEMDVARIF